MKEELIRAIIPALIGATISGTPTYLLLSMKSEQLGEANKKIEFLDKKYRKALVSIETVQSEFNKLNEDHNQLKDKYNDLYLEYKKATSATGLTIKHGYSSKLSKNKTISVGGKIEFNVWGAGGNFSIKLKKVTPRGPVVKIENCSYYQIVSLDPQQTPIPHEYLIPIHDNLMIDVYESCCLKNGPCEMTEDADRITIAAVDIDVEKYTCVFNFHQEIRSK